MCRMLGFKAFGFSLRVRVFLGLEGFRYRV